LPRASIHIRRDQCEDDRFQHQGVLVRLYRRLRYQPLYFLIRWFMVLCWLLKGLPRNTWRYSKVGSNDLMYDTRWQTFCSILMVWKSRCAMKMRWYWLTEEVIADIRNKPRHVLSDKQRKMAPTEVPLDSIKHRLKR
jgi:hypothetical protein